MSLDGRLENRHHSGMDSVLQDKSHSRYVLTADGQEAFESGSPEAQVYAAIPDQGISMADLQVRPS